MWHQSDPFTLVEGSGREREYLVVEDEFAGAVGTGQCPNGGVWFHQVTGDRERNPALVGSDNIDDVRPTNSLDGTCKAHVSDIHEREQVMTIAWYNGGVRVPDLSRLAGVTVGGTLVPGEGVREVGFARFPDSDTWSAKTPRIKPPHRRLLPVRERHRPRSRHLDVRGRRQAVLEAGPLDERRGGAGVLRRTAGGAPDHVLAALRVAG